MRIEVRAYKDWQLREMYGVSYKTWKRWLAPFSKEIGKVNGRLYTPKQVRIIFELLDPPTND